MSEGQVQLERVATAAIMVKDLSRITVAELVGGE